MLFCVTPSCGVFLINRCYSPDETQVYRSRTTVFITHCNMFRLSKPAIIREVPDTQKEYDGAEVWLCSGTNYSNIIAIL
jgi:hypothetical protein